MAKDRYKWLGLLLVVGVLCFSDLAKVSSNLDPSAAALEAQHQIALAIALLAVGAAALLAGVPGEERETR